MGNALEEPGRAGVMQGIAGNAESGRLSGGKYSLRFREF